MVWSGGDRLRLPTDSHVAGARGAAVLPLGDHERGALLPCKMDMTFSVYSYLNREKDAWPAKTLLVAAGVRPP